MATAGKNYRLTPIGGVASLNLRVAEGTNFPNVESIKRGDKLVVIEDPDLALAKLGVDGQWINIRTPNNKEAWCAAWLLEAAVESKPAIHNNIVPVPFFVTATSNTLNVRSGDLSKLPHRIHLGRNVSIVAGESVTIVEDPSIAFKKVALGAPTGANREYQWIHVRTAAGIEGWCAAWYLAVAPNSDTPPPLPKRDSGTVIVNPDDDSNHPTPPSVPSPPTTTVEQAQAFIKQAYDVTVKLRSIAEFDEMQKLIAQILGYGIGLRNSHEVSGSWTLDEVRQVHGVIESTATVTGNIFKAMYRVDNKEMAFKALYAPMVIARDGRKYVGPSGQRWYAKNSNGFDLIFGDSAFFDGAQQSSVLRSTKRTFTAAQLVAHEIAHAINWRYHVLVEGNLQEVDRYYEKNVELADGMGKHDGFVFGAQSSADEWETVTDAIASLNLTLFTGDVKGIRRQAQIVGLMKLVIQYRQAIFDASDLDLMLSNANRSNPGLFDRLKPIVATTNLQNVDKWLDNLVKPPVVTVPTTPAPSPSPTVPSPVPGSNEWVAAQLLLESSYVNVRGGAGLEFHPPVGRINDKEIVSWQPQSKKRDKENRYDWVQIKTNSVAGWVAYRDDAMKFVATEKKPDVAAQLTNGVIDISHWQVIDDWDALVKAGVIGIIHKATQGTGFLDNMYAQNHAKARALNLLWGSYHFGTAADPIKQAQHYLASIGSLDNHLLVLDFEGNSLNGADSMHLEQAEAFVSYVREKTGKWCVLYTGNWYLKEQVPRNGNTVLSNCALWLASYTKEPPTVIAPWKRWMIWQYSNGVDGSEPKDLPGISRVDRNLFNGDLAALKQFWKQL